jgi:hypothetical protein
MNDLARRGLGRGLSALLGGDPVRVDPTPGAPSSPRPDPVATYTPTTTYPTPAVEPPVGW